MSSPLSDPLRYSASATPVPAVHEAAGATVAAVATTEASDDLAGDGDHGETRRRRLSHHRTQDLCHPMGSAPTLSSSPRKLSRASVQLLVEAEAAGPGLAKGRRRTGKQGRRHRRLDIRRRARSGGPHCSAARRGGGPNSTPNGRSRSDSLAGIASRRPPHRPRPGAHLHRLRQEPQGVRAANSRFFRTPASSSLKPRLEARVLRVFLDRCIAEFIDGRLDAPDQRGAQVLGVRTAVRDRRRLRPAPRRLRLHPRLPDRAHVAGRPHLQASTRTPSGSSPTSGRRKIPIAASGILGRSNELGLARPAAGPRAS